ncbi:hypothetical protein [Halorubrum vacuolatum]|uniref:Uncharacterized protein n=1 Tax=Halorubrum vacuolatum TaxID=63740 RepID=A0A238UQJ1_HALVU|nr:hypothetical protein [Halorubrum vacuolatum]SNR23569.1 hypothetical protein SAMN06264855_101141 [Halorubrum vacuolatum]
MSRLALQSIGVDGEVQPRSEYPSLANGIHLRWAFPPHHGFPPGGYYLLRRGHREPGATDALLSAALDHDPEDPLAAAETSEGHRFEFEDHARIETVTDDQNAVGLSISGVEPFRIDVPDPAFRVDVSVGTEVLRDSVTVRAFTDGRVVDEATTKGGTVSLAGDRIDAIDCVGAHPKVDPVFVSEIAAYLVTENLRGRWQLLHRTPIRLPVAHDDYGDDDAPATIEAARRLATDRIAYGDPARLTADPDPEPGPGTVTVTAGSPYVFAPGLRSDANVVGRNLHVHGDDTAYGIAAIGAATAGGARLVLNRPYRGQSGANRAYEVRNDEFAALHDTLSVLVDGNGGGGSGGPPVGGMGSRTMPAFEDPGGVAYRNGDPSTIYGAGVDWASEMAGSRIRFATGAVSGMAAVHGRPLLFGAETGLDESFIGDHVRIGAERELYRIVDLTHYDIPEASFEICLLDRPVSGPHYGDTVACVTFSSVTHRIESVDPAQSTLQLEHDALGLRDGLPRGYLVHPDAPDGSHGSIPLQNPLDTVLTAATDPAAAQALGLYWVDDAVDPNGSYDYLIVADHGEVIPSTGVGAGMVINELVSSMTTPRLDWYVAFDVGGGDESALPSPADPRVFSLPATAETENTVGLRWAMADDSEGARSDAAATPIKYHLWRWEGDNGADVPAELDAYDPITAASADEFLDGAMPILATNPDDSPALTPEDWPDERMHAIETGLADGWYSYRVVGVDVFGRFSERSDPATWSTNDPIESADSPHAQQAIEVVSDRSPPPPTAIEAAALDPAAYSEDLLGLDADEIPPNPDIRQDATYRSWRAANPSETGLRVRWCWPEEHADIAPDVAEFDVYVAPGRRNTHVGEITGVTATTTGFEVTVDVGLDGAEPAVFAGTTLVVATAAFPVESAVAVDDGIELTVRPPIERNGAATDGGQNITDGGQNITDGGQAESVADALVTDDGFVTMFPAGDVGPLEVSITEPEVGDRCSLVVPPAYTEGTVTVDAAETTEIDGTTGTVVTGHRTEWNESLEGRNFRTVDDDVAYEVAGVEGPTELVLDRQVESTTPGSYLPYRIAHPLWTDGTDPGAWGDPVGTIGFDDADATIGTDGLGGIDPGTTVYETIVSAPESDEGEAFAPSLSVPTVYADVTVTASDGSGNESPVDGTATVARVHRETPDSPSGPTIEVDFERATHPDYDGESAYTVRWEPLDGGDAYGYHVFRALDETLFATDLERRVAAEDEDGDLGDGLPLDADDERFFPPALRGSDGSDERDTIVEALQTFDAHAKTIDKAEDDEAAADARAAAMADYRALREAVDPSTDDATESEATEGTDAEALRPAILATLAALPGNETAFSQRTDSALVPSEHDDRVGPDGDAAYDPDDDLCAWVDHFDGVARNCYLYRVGTVDDAGNRSDAREDDGTPMSYPTMPVKSPAVVPPPTPRIVDVGAGHPDEDVDGDRMITLRIEGVTGPAVDHLLVYRTEDAAAADDLRSMAGPETVVPEEDGIIAEDDTHLLWVETDVEPFTTTYYRVVAVSEAGIHTKPTPPVSGQAFDRSPPETPSWETEDPAVDDDGDVTLAWTPAGDAGDLMYQVQRRPDDSDDDEPDDDGPDWRAIGPWTRDTAVTDRGRDPDGTYDYRLRVKGATGGMNDDLELKGV